MFFGPVLGLSALALILAPYRVMLRTTHDLRHTHGADAVRGLEALRAVQRRTSFQLGILCVLLMVLCLVVAVYDAERTEDLFATHRLLIVVYGLGLAAVVGGAFVPLGSRELIRLWTGASWKWWQHLRYVLFWQWMFLGRGPAILYGALVVLVVDLYGPHLDQLRDWLWVGAPLALAGLYTSQLLLTPLSARLLFCGRRVPGTFPVRRYRYRSYGSRLPLAFAGGLFRRGASITYNDALEQALDEREFEAVILHEQAHIETGDVCRRLLVVLRGIGVATGIGLAVAELAVGDAWISAIAALVAPFVGVLGSTIFLRRQYWEQELEADVYAAQRVGIDTYGRALIKVHRILRLPPEWAPGDRSQAMHPPLVRRLHEIGYRHWRYSTASAKEPSSPADAQLGDRPVYLEFHPVMTPPPRPLPVHSDDVPARYRPRYRYSPPLRPDRR